MGARDSLEAALLASWDRETLAVYADHLQAQGDPRGELIALDLELASRSTPELVARRTSLMTAWLGRLVPSNPHTPWVGDSFKFGFVENLVLEDDEEAAARLAQVLATPLAPYLKRVTIRGDAAHVAEMMRGLSEAEHPHAWLTDLVVRCWSGTVATDVVARWIEMTPALSRLEVQGHEVFEQFSHPGVQRLKLTGVHALPGVFTAESLPNVRELDLAFDQPYDGEHYTHPVSGPIEPLQLPALRVLDLSRNEPEAIRTPYGGDPDIDYYDDGDDDAPAGTALDAREVLAVQPIRMQLTHLELPSIRSRQELERLEAIVGHMHALEEIEVSRAHYFKLPAKLATSKARFVRPASWPWPKVSEIPHGDGLHVVIPGSRSGDTVPIADAASVMERRFEELDAEARFAWTRFWAFVDELGRLPWKSDPRETWTDDRTFPATILATAVDACEIGGSGGWRELRDSLRFRRPFAPDAMLTVRRVRTL